MLILGGVAILVSLTITFLLRFFAAIIIYSMVILAALGALVGTGFCWYQWFEYKSTLDTIPPAEQIKEDKKLVNDWLIYASIMSAGSFILLLILLYLRKSIALVVQLFREGGKAIAKMPYMLIQPMWTLIFMFLTIGIVGYGSLYVFSAGHPKIDEKTGFVEYEADSVLYVSSTKSNHIISCTYIFILYLKLSVFYTVCPLVLPVWYTVDNSVHFLMSRDGYCWGSSRMVLHVRQDYH